MLSLKKAGRCLGVFHPRAREETPESRGMPCLFLNTERGFGGKPPQKSGFGRHLGGSKMPKEGSKMPKETFFHGDLPLESGLAARARCLGFLAGVAAGSRPRSSATSPFPPAPVSGAARRWRAPESRAGRAPTLLRCLAPAPRSAARWPQRTRSAYQASSIST